MVLVGIWCPEPVSHLRLLCGSSELCCFPGLNLNAFVVLLLIWTSFKNQEMRNFTFRIWGNWTGPASANFRLQVTELSQSQNRVGKAAAFLFWM